MFHLRERSGGWVQLEDASKGLLLPAIKTLRELRGEEMTHLRHLQ